MYSGNKKLTLHNLEIYQITVPGQLNEGWTEWNGHLSVAVSSDDNGRVVTTLTGSLDQAALHDVLRRLYALGLPLIAVTCLPEAQIGPRWKGENRDDT